MVEVTVAAAIAAVVGVAVVVRRRNRRGNPRRGFFDEAERSRFQADQERNQWRMDPGGGGGNDF